MVDMLGEFGPNKVDTKVLGSVGKRPIALNHTNKAPIQKKQRLPSIDAPQKSTLREVGTLNIVLTKNPYGSIKSL